VVLGPGNPVGNDGLCSAGQQFRTVRFRELKAIRDRSREIGHAVLLPIGNQLQNRQHAVLVIGEGHGSLRQNEFESDCQRIERNAGNRTCCRCEFPNRRERLPNKFRSHSVPMTDPSILFGNLSARSIFGDPGTCFWRLFVMTIPIIESLHDISVSTVTHARSATLREAQCPGSAHCSS